MLTKFYTLAEISEMTHISNPYLKGSIYNGTIKATKMTKCYLVNEYELLTFIESMEVKINEMALNINKDIYRLLSGLNELEEFKRLLLCTDFNNESQRDLCR